MTIHYRIQEWSPQTSLNYGIDTKDAPWSWRQVGWRPTLRRARNLAKRISRSSGRATRVIEVRSDGTHKEV